jgi:hypothetical protein
MACGLARSTPTGNTMLPRHRLWAFLLREGRDRSTIQSTICPQDGHQGCGEKCVLLLQRFEASVDGTSLAGLLAHALPLGLCSDMRHMLDPFRRRGIFRRDLVSRQRRQFFLVLDVCPPSWLLRARGRWRWWQSSTRRRRWHGRHFFVKSLHCRAMCSWWGLRAWSRRHRPTPPLQSISRNGC